MDATRLFPYPEGRMLEDAAYARGSTPTLVVPFLLPVWSVEIEATVTDAEPYGLIDRYLERGIAEGRLDTAADLARFFALDDTLIYRALHVLDGIGHVTKGPDGRLTLTELGHRSVRDQVRYIQKRKDRRKLYFDAFGSRPLTSRYYDPSAVTLLSGQELLDVVERRDGPAFRMPVSLRVFHDAALAALAELPDRDRFNLPDRIDEPKRVGDPECVFLPMYIVRAAGRDGAVEHLAYTQAADTADDDLGAICARSPEIIETVEREAAETSGRAAERAGEWLLKRDLARLRPVRIQNGMLRVTFPASSFGGDRSNGRGSLSLSKLGSFVVLDCGFFQVWCADERVRGRALLERAGSYLGSRARVRRTELQTRVARIGRQVGLGDVDLAELRRMAARAGRHDLTAQIDDVAGGPSEDERREEDR